MKKLCSIILIILIFYCSLTTAYAQSMLCLQLNGINGEAKKNVQARLDITKSPCISFQSTAAALRFYNKSKAKITKALQPYGFFRPHIRSKLLYSRQEWIALYYIDTGEPIRITRLNIKLTGPGSNNPAIRHYMNALPLKEGDVFDVPNYDKIKNTLFKIVRNQGYIKAHLKNKIIINLNQYTCDITFHLETGERYYFGDIEFNSYQYCRTFLIRALDICKGEPFSSLKLISRQQAMEQSDFFREVIVTPNFEHPNQNEIPIDIDYNVPKRVRYELGLGYGTFTGPRLSANMRLQRLGQYGQHVEAKLTLSSILKSISAFYYVPGNQPLNDTWLYGASYKGFNPKAGKSRSLTFTGGYTTKRDRWSTNLNFNFLIEKFKITPTPYKDTHELYPNLTISYVNTDNLIKPNYGFYLSLNLQGTSKVLVSQTSFLQSLIKAKYLFKPFSFAKIIGRAEYGYTWTHDMSVFPLSLRFFAGGINSIRGFADSSIGPGRFVTTGSLEYQNHLYKDWSGAIFYDAGIASNHFSGPVNRGAGVGIIYSSVIGPIKLYLARAVSKKTEPWSIEFSAGPEFA